MFKKPAQAWLAGVAVALLISLIGSTMNFRSQAVPAPQCENRETVTYIGCGHANNSMGEYYLTGWPNKMYCRFDGKNTCSPWSDFLYVERNNEKVKMWKENLVLISLSAATMGLLSTSLILTNNQRKKHNAHTRD